MKNFDRVETSWTLSLAHLLCDSVPIRTPAVEIGPVTAQQASKAIDVTLGDVFFAATQSSVGVEEQWTGMRG